MCVITVQLYISLTRPLSYVEIKIVNFIQNTSTFKNNEYEYSAFNKSKSLVLKSVVNGVSPFLI